MTTITRITRIDGQQFDTVTTDADWYGATGPVVTDHSAATHLAQGDPNEWSTSERAASRATCTWCAAIFTAAGTWASESGRAATETERAYDVQDGNGRQGGRGNGRRPVTPASEKQVAFLDKLLADKQHSYTETDVAAAKASSRKASTLIDALVKAPRRADAKTPASEKQMAYLTQLFAEREIGAFINAILDAEIMLDDCRKDAKAASRVIEWAAAHPRKTVSRTAQATGSTVEEGMYRTADGSIYKVQRAVHGSGNLYAKRLVVLDPGCGECGGDHACAHNYPKTGTFEYAAGVVRKLTADDRMTLADAQAFGKLYGVCCRCGKTLTDENSIEAGIGPVCASKMDH